MKIASIAALGLALLMSVATIDADAKRVGAGRSSGMQRDMPARTAPDSTPAKPAAPGQQANPAQTPAAAAAPAAAPKRNWMGPLAGLAAGLGLAALMSHLGMGEAFGSFLLMALAAVAVIFVVRMLMRRKQPQAQPAGMAYTGSAAGAGQVAWPTTAPAASGGSSSAASPALSNTPDANPDVSVAPAPAATAPARAFVPAVFDAEGFARTAKMIFIRLQAANDTADLDDLRAFTTPEMFAELSLDVKERAAGQVQHTEVVTIESEVLDVSDEGTRQVVSVRMRGQVREESGATPVAVDEVWHLVKPADGSRNWAIAGIEQWK